MAYDEYLEKRPRLRLRLRVRKKVPVPVFALNLDLNLNLDFEERGATGFDGDTEVTVACRALGNS